MQVERIVKFSDNLQSIADKNQDLIGSELGAFIREHGIEPAKDLASAFAQLQENNRLLNIGIVGRVKAGKSSLLNALIFEGESILPKAATPMTAALTTITWGERFKAEVEFFTPDDIEVIKDRHAEYARKFDSKKFEVKTQLLEKQKEKTEGGRSPEKIDEMADKQARKALQADEALVAAHDQYERMQKSGMAVSDLSGEIFADSPKALATKLSDYVGADGRYMPFTKTVHIFMPVEGLRDIRVIDTPGLNDPVQSREARTVDLLKTCDVVFIVSPAGQFLNEQDLDVMSRITRKEGVQELVLVASQVDTQLFGSEKRATLNESLAQITSQLSVRAKEVLSQMKRSHPEVGSVFDGLINSVSDNLLHSSGLCHSLSRMLDNPDAWDSNERAVWNNLAESYPDFISDANRATTESSLNTLANIDSVLHVLSVVRGKKDSILAEKIELLARQKLASLEALKAHLTGLANEGYELVKNSDVDSLKAQLELIEERKEDFSNFMTGKLSYFLQGFNVDLHKSMLNELDSQLSEISDAIESSSGLHVSKIIVDKTGIFNKLLRSVSELGTKEVITEELKINSTNVLDEVEDFLVDVDLSLRGCAIKASETFNSQLSALVVAEVRRIFEDEVDHRLVNRSVVSAIESIPKVDFEIDSKLPKEIKVIGILIGSKAEKFRDGLNAYVRGLKSSIRRDIASYVRNFEVLVPGKISDVFIGDLSKRLNALEKQIDDKELSLDQYERLKKSIAGVQF